MKVVRILILLTEKKIIENGYLQECLVEVPWFPLSFSSFNRTGINSICSKVGILFISFRYHKLTFWFYWGGATLPYVIK